MVDLIFSFCWQAEIESSQFESFIDSDEEEGRIINNGVKYKLLLKLKVLSIFVINLKSLY